MSAINKVKKKIVNKITSEDIKHLANLANLPLTKGQAKEFSEELTDVIKYNMDITQNEHNKYSKELTEIIKYNVEHLNNIDTTGIEPTAHAVGEKSVTRDDLPAPGLEDTEALKNTNESHNKFFKVKRVLGD